MRTSAAGSERPALGFTLIELLVVVAIVAIATVGVTLALRDPQGTQVERDAQRLAALLESARAQSRASGVPVRWKAANGGFTFEGLKPGTLPDRWLSEDTRVEGNATLVLGPEPIIGRQEVVLAAANAPQYQVRVATDGLRPFTVTLPGAGS
jgi:general secretion pathway protein H